MTDVQKLKTFLKLKSNKKKINLIAKELSAWYRDCSGMNTWLGDYNSEAKILFLLANDNSLKDCYTAVYGEEE